MYQNWSIKKLGEVARIEGGGTPSTKNPLFWNGDIPWLTPKELSNFSDKEINDTERKITKAGLERSSTKLFPAGTVLLTSRAPIGYVAIAGVQMATNQGFKNFICNPDLDNGFLYYFLKLKTKYLQSLGRGATFTEISRSILTKVEIPLPPLATQKQIVEKLDKIAEAQKLNDGLIQKTDELFQSLLNQELNPIGKDWEVRQMMDVTEIRSGSGFPMVIQGKTDGEVPFYKVSDMNLGGNEIDMIFHNNSVTELQSKSSKFKPALAGTIIFPKIGAAIATNKKRILSRKALYDNNVMGLIPNDSILSKYLYFWILKFNISTWASESIPPSIKKSTVEKFEIPLPTLNEQKQIVAKLSAVQDYKKQLLAQKAKLKELFDSALAG